MRKHYPLVLTCAVSFAAMTNAEPLGFDDLPLDLGLIDPRISPNGARALVIVRRRNFEANRMENQLFLVDVSSGERRALTHDRHAVSNPRWSPDGESIAFLAQDEQEKSTNHVMPLRGGEAKKISRPETGVMAFEWSPDGTTFAFVAPEPPVEREEQAEHNRSFEVGGDWYLADKVSPENHIWRVDADEGEPKRLTTDHTLAYLVGSFAWSADGQSVVYGAQPDGYSASFLRGSLRRVSLDGVDEALLADPAPYGGALPSPDGEWIAFVKSRGDEMAFHPGGVFAIPAAGGARRDLTAQIDRDVFWAKWAPDSRAIWVAAPDGTTVSIWRQPIDSMPTKVDLDDVVFGGGSVAANGQLLFTGSTASSGAELYVLDGVDAPPRQLTDFHGALAERTLGRVETIEWTNDGFDQDGVLIYPPEFDASKRYPLVLMIHGGPMSSSTTQFNIFAQIAAAHGWLVFQPNYRGSNNRGDAFQSAVINDAGAGPGRDVMAGVEAVIAKGFVDEDRLASTGWSYGGYMTVWLTAHYDVWRAAVAGAAVTDWFDWYTLSDMNVWSGYGLGGSPWIDGNDEHYRAQSPITYAKNIQAPTLILSTTFDPRVSVTQSFKLYSVLRDHGVPVKFVAYPVPGHFPGDPVHSRDVFQRWFAWLEEHFDAAHL